MLGGLAIYFPVANFLQCICAKNYGNWLAVDKVIAKITRLTFFWPTLYVLQIIRQTGYLVNFERRLLLIKRQRIIQINALHSVHISVTYFSYSGITPDTCNYNIIETSRKEMLETHPDYNSAESHQQGYILSERGGGLTSCVKLLTA